MAERSSIDVVHEEVRRKIAAWRVAVRGVRSTTPDAPGPAAHRDMASLQNPEAEARFELQRSRRGFWGPVVLGGLAVFSVALAFVMWPGVALAVYLALQGAVIARAAHKRRKRVRDAVGRVLNAAFNLIGLGRLREAGAILAEIEIATTEAWALRLVDIQLATIAIRRGEMEPAERHLTSAISRPLDRHARDNALYQLEGAHALRAFVRASLGRHDDARADIDHVRGTSASPDAIARVTLAEAMILEQQGKRGELRVLLADEGALMLEHSHPRERAIVRAYQRMVRADKASVYRRAEVRREKTEGEEPMLADWVARVAPGAAEFVRSPRSADHAATVAPAQAMAPPSPEALRANAEAKKPAPNRSTRTLLGTAVAAIVAIGGVVGMAEALRSGSTDVASSAAAGMAGGANAVALIILLSVVALPMIFGVAYGLRWLARRRAEAAVRRVGGERRDPAARPSSAALRAHTESPSPVVAAQAWLLLADRAERHADFQSALDAATSGLSRLSDQRDRVAADIVYPDLVSLRAFALAACGRFHESNAELASLGPGYPHHGRAVFRARLLMHVRSGDLAGAAAWLDQSEADLPLSVREELLADLVRAAVSPGHAGAAEIQRLRDELATPALRSWIKVAAPGLLEVFERSTTVDVGLRIEPFTARGAHSDSAHADSAHADDAHADSAHADSAHADGVHDAEEEAAAFEASPFAARRSL